DGYFALTMSNAYDRRVSAAVGYLDPATRARPNLEILTQAQASGLVFEGKTCVGVNVVRDGQEREYRPKEEILSAGTIHSPAMLLRAGIGPAVELKEHGITVLADRPGVGKGMMDHAAVIVAAWMKPEARLDRRMKRHATVGLRYSSGLPEAPGGD